VERGVRILRAGSEPFLLGLYEVGRDGSVGIATEP